MGFLALRDLDVRAGAVLKADGVLRDSPNAGTPAKSISSTTGSARNRPQVRHQKPLTANLISAASGFQVRISSPKSHHSSHGPPRRRGKYADRPGDDPRAQCMPTGVTRMHALDLVKFVQTPGLLLALVEGRHQPCGRSFSTAAVIPPTCSPHGWATQVGRWDKDTLVIDTTGFNDKVWLEGNRPQTEQLHVIERYLRIDRGRMSVEITIDDPGAYTRPWKVRRLLQLAEARDSGIPLRREPQDRALRRR
jgi:hypothetical protein